MCPVDLSWADVLQNVVQPFFAKICGEFESHIFLLVVQIPAGIAPCSQPIGSTYGGFTFV